MEFTKDIHFSNILRGNKTSEITYSGELFQKQSESVTIVYGFGENWESTTETEMKKTENGFTVQVEMKENFDTFNFCFRNGNYEWDNNQSFNYISPIQPAIVETKKVNIHGFTGNIDGVFGNTTKALETDGGLGTTENGIDGEFNNDVLLSILDNLLEQTLQTIGENEGSGSDNKQQILDDILSENIETSTNDFVTSEERFDMDTLVEDILNPVINFETTGNDLGDSTTFFETNTSAVENLNSELIEELSFIGTEENSSIGTKISENVTVSGVEEISQKVVTAETNTLSKDENATTDLVPVSENTF